MGGLFGGMLLARCDCLTNLAVFDGGLLGGMLLARWDCPTNLAVFGGGSLWWHVTGQVGLPDQPCCVWWGVFVVACYWPGGTVQLTLLCLVGGLFGGMLLARWDCPTNLAVFGGGSSWWHVTGQLSTSTMG